MESSTFSRHVLCIRFARAILEACVTQLCRTDGSGSKLTTRRTRFFPRLQARPLVAGFTPLPVFRRVIVIAASMAPPMLVLRFPHTCVLFSARHFFCPSIHPPAKVMLAGGVVGRVQNIAGIDGAEPIPGYAGLNTAAGYSSSGSSNGSNGVHSDRIDPAIVASSAIGAGRRRRDSPVEGVTSAAAAAADATTTAASAAAAAPTPARSSRPVRKFRAERVQGRSWSVEGGEVVARGAGGEEIRGGGDAFDDGASFDRRRGKGGRGRGRR